MNNWDMRLPGAEMWGPYLEQSPVPPAAFAENPWEALRSFLPESLPTALHTAASWYAAVLTFLVLGAVIALLLGGHADGTLLDLVCAGGCGVLLWEKLVALSETLCTQIESWNRFLLGFLPVYAGVLTLGGESVAGASAGGFLLTLLCALAQGLTVLVPPLLQCYLALSMACCICAETGLGSFCKAVGRALEKLLGWAGKLLVALLGLERISTLQLDRAALRTGQLLTGTVPIIGETLRDASETVLSCLQLLKSGLGLAALLTIAAEFVPVYLGMLIQLGLLSGCGLLCGMMGSERCQSLLECFAEALRCMMAVTALFAGLAIAGTALLFVVGGGCGAEHQSGGGSFLHGVYLRGADRTAHRAGVGPAQHKSGGWVIYFSSGPLCASAGKRGVAGVRSPGGVFGGAGNTEGDRALRGGVSAGRHLGSPLP